MGPLNYQFIIYFIIISHLCLSFPIGLFFLGLLTKILHILTLPCMVGTSVGYRSDLQPEIRVPRVYAKVSYGVCEIEKETLFNDNIK
jgi:hypothetical protein